jgi:hypothetical protein
MCNTPFTCMAGKHDELRDPRSCEACDWTGPDDDVEIEGPAELREFCPACGAILGETE